MPRVALERRGFALALVPDHAKNHSLSPGLRAVGCRAFSRARPDRSRRRNTSGVGTIGWCSTASLHADFAVGPSRSALHGFLALITDAATGAAAPDSAGGRTGRFPQLCAVHEYAEFCSDTSQNRPFARLTTAHNDHQC